MDVNRGPDPNLERNDPMVPEYWQLGEDLQDAVRNAGYDPAEVEGIAVDVHDLLQAVDQIRDVLIPAATSAVTPEALAAVRQEWEHVRWHCEAAIKYLSAAESALSSYNGE